MPPYNAGGELSLRHLPDVSDASFSFQIPGSAQEENLLAQDIDFFRGADVSEALLQSPARNDQLTLSQVTPRRKADRVPSTTQPSSPRQTYQKERQDTDTLDAITNPVVEKRKTPLTRARYREITKGGPSTSKATSKNNRTPKSKAKLIAPSLSHFHPVEASPAVARLKTLRAELDTLSEDIISPISFDPGEDKDVNMVEPNRYESEDTAGPQTSTSSSHVKEQPQIPNETRREKRPRTSKQKVIVEGGITKKRMITTRRDSIKPPEKKAISATRTVSRKETSSTFSLSPPPSLSKDLDGEEQTSITDASMASLDVGGGVAARLVKYSQNLINPFRQAQTQLTAGTTLSIKIHSTDVPKSASGNDAAVSGTGTNSDAKILTGVAHETNSSGTDGPLTLSQLSPRKRRRMAAARLRSDTPPPPASAPASDNSASPLRLSTKRPLAAEAAATGERDDDNASADAGHRRKKARNESKDALNAGEDSQACADSEPKEMTVNGKILKRARRQEVLLPKDAHGTTSTSASTSVQSNSPDPHPESGSEVQSEVRTSESKSRPDEGRGRKRRISIGETREDSRTKGSKTKTRSRITAGGSTRGNAITGQAPPSDLYDAASTKTKSGPEEINRSSSKSIEGPDDDSSPDVKQDLITAVPRHLDAGVDEKTNNDDGSAAQQASSESSSSSSKGTSATIRATSARTTATTTATKGTSTSSSTSKPGPSSSSQPHSRQLQQERSSSSEKPQHAVDRVDDPAQHPTHARSRTRSNATLPANKDNDDIASAAASASSQSNSVSLKGKGRAVSSSVSVTRSSSRQATRSTSTATAAAAPPLPTATRPVEFRFQTDAVLEARKGKTNADSQSSSRSQSRLQAPKPNPTQSQSQTRASQARSQSRTSQSRSQSRSQSHSQSQSQSQSRRSNYHPAPDFKAIHAAQAAELAKKKENIHPTIPIEPQWETDKRMKERKEFDEMMKEKEREKKRLEDEEKRRREEEEEREVRELRKKLVVKAHEVPEWYKEAPKKKEAEKDKEGETMKRSKSGSTLGTTKSRR